jgi:thiol:disulfide interchange protein DsbD
VVAALLAAASVANLSDRTATATAHAAGAEPYSVSRVAALRAEGKPVLVNFTAAWCITCLVNERVAFSTNTVKKAMADSGVAYLKADWTNRNPEITAALHELGRDGVPAYALYPKGTGAPQLLPQVLTPAMVAAALMGAAASP